MATYSFEIFDTCLVRRCGSPENVFDILSYKAFKRPVSESIRQAFVVERKNAEKNAFNPFLSLEQIYEAFSLVNEDLLTKDELIKLELETEKHVLSPVGIMLTKIEKLRKKGHQIIYISDMYLPEEFIRQILEETGFCKPNDCVYVSGTRGVWKYSGELFKFVHNELGIPYNKWHHTGDNKQSDQKVPRNLGIHTNRIKHRFSPAQQMMFDTPCLGYNWPGIIAGLSKALLLEEIDQQPHKDLFVDICLPFLVSHTVRILQQAEKDGIKNLYFCARDAYVLYKIALKFKDFYPNIEFQMLSISQKSLYDGNQENALKYFISVGLANHKERSTRIVDIRTSGKTLSVINSILSSNGYCVISQSCYELLGKNNFENTSESLYYEQYSPYITRGNKSRHVSNHWYIYELIFPLNNLYRTIDYSNDGTPIFENTRTSEVIVPELDKIILWRDNVMNKYVDYYIHLGLLNHSDELFSQIAINNLSTFLSLPNKRYVAGLDGIIAYNEITSEWVPYVKHSIMFAWLAYKKKVMWHNGTYAYNIPRSLLIYLYKIKKLLK